MCSIHEENLSQTLACFLQPGFQLGFAELRLCLDGFGQRRLGRDGDGGYLPRGQSQTVQEVADLGQPAADTGVLVCDVPRRLGTPWRMLVDKLFHRYAI